LQGNPYLVLKPGVSDFVRPGHKKKKGSHF